MLMDEFDEGLWIATVEAVVVYSEDEITFKFRDGMEFNKSGQELDVSCVNRL